MATAVPADGVEASDEADSSLPFYDIVLVGEEGVGKTSIYKRLESNTFIEGTMSTLGVDHFDRTHELSNGEKVRVRLWDTAGAERYRAMTRSYYKNAKAVVFVYSLDKSSSLTCLTFWIEDATAYAPKDALWVFVCNKTDLPLEDQVVFDHDIEAFFENQFDGVTKEGRPQPLRRKTSAKTGDGVLEALQAVLHKLSQKPRLDSQLSTGTNPLTPSVRVDRHEPPKEKPCPC